MMEILHIKMAAAYLYVCKQKAVQTHSPHVCFFLHNKFDRLF